MTLSLTSKVTSLITQPLNRKVTSLMTLNTTSKAA
jgi:hypothetical protein